ncbi:MAG TPA: TraB/GumN family protein [Candidatus Angelobacter sp.]|nr:TraB/GumN family protein [Candidatus Angelobacter sp.]
MLKFKRKYTVVWIALLALLATCQGQTQATSQPQVNAKARRWLMWKASSPTTTVYMLGSIHLGDKELYPLPDALESAFNASKVLVVEVNIKKIDQAGAMKLVQQYGFYPEGDSLSKHLPRNLSDSLDDFCSKHGLPRALLDKFKPWVAAITIEALTLQQAGEDPNLGVDVHFLDESKQPQRIEELETADFQMTVLSSGTEAEQQELLAETLKEMDKPKEHLLEIQSAFLSGDQDVMVKFLQAHNTPKALYKKLLDDRNGPMAERIDGYLKGKEQCFVVVGAAHLVGDKGIVKLLQQKNYKVELITAEAK